MRGCSNARCHIKGDVQEGLRSTLGLGRRPSLLTFGDEGLAEAIGAAEHEELHAEPWYHHGS